MIINCILKKPVYTDYVLDAVSLQKKRLFPHLQNASKCKSSFKKKVLAMTLTSLRLNSVVLT